MAVLLMSSAMVSAQDIITKKDGQDIKVKVLEVGTADVRYRLFEEPEGAIYTVNTTAVHTPDYYTPTANRSKALFAE